MKKLLAVFLCILLSAAVFTACDFPMHEHIKGQWEFNASQHWQSVTCTWNICKINIVSYDHIDEDENGLCDVCGYSFISTEPVPLPVPTNCFLRNQAGCSWLYKITAEDIAEVKIITEAVGVAPGTFTDITHSTEETAIARIFEAYYSLNTTPIPSEMGEIDGGGAVTVKFILKDNTQKEIYINNGNYRDTNGNYFKLFYTPEFEAEEYVSSYGFITYQGMATLWACDPIGMEPQYICQFPMEEIEFAEVMDEIVLDGKELSYYIETDFGKLYFLSEIYFYIDGVVEGDIFNGEEKPVYFQLYGKNLEELISEYAEHTP